MRRRIFPTLLPILYQKRCFTSSMKCLLLFSEGRKWLVYKQMKGEFFLPSLPVGYDDPLESTFSAYILAGRAPASSPFAPLFHHRDYSTPLSVIYGTDPCPSAGVYCQTYS